MTDKTNQQPTRDSASKKRFSKTSQVIKSYSSASFNKIVDDIDDGAYDEAIVESLETIPWSEVLGEHVLAAIDNIPLDSALDGVVRATLGSIPWLGGFVNAAASIRASKNTKKALNAQMTWINLHHDKLQDLYKTMGEYAAKLQRLDESIDEHVRIEVRNRLQSKEYLGIVSKSFRVWDAADTAQKRKLIANLISNSSYSRICSDDVIRLFVDWLDSYHEAHFSVIHKIYDSGDKDVTRYDIWCQIWGEDIPDLGSPEADLFDMIIRDLSTGGVIRQQKEESDSGKMVTREIPTVSGRNVKGGSFDDTKPYELTALGKQFVHYTMQDAVIKLDEM